VRSRIAVLAPRPSFLAVLLLAGAGFGWLLGELAAVNALSQFALVAMLIFAVPAVLGWRSRAASPSRSSSCSSPSLSVTSPSPS
jgi:hypothetical protein